jgi:hypothetical protein
MAKPDLIVLGAISLALIILVIAFSFLAMGAREKPAPILQTEGQPVPETTVPIPSGLHCNGGTSPFSLTYFRLVPDGTLVLVPCNNAPDTMTLKSLSLRDGYSSGSLSNATLSGTTFAPGKVPGYTATFKVKTCTEGEIREFSEITFTYDTPSISNLKQIGSRNLVVKCS